MTKNIIQMVNLLDLMRALEGSVDASIDVREGREDWMVRLTARKFEDVWNDGSSASDLLDGAEQMQPIVVCVNGTGDYCEGKTWVLGNGNHRFATLIALASEEALVVFTERTDDYMLTDISSDSGC
jgi:hypothetical protein